MSSPFQRRICIFSRLPRLAPRFDFAQHSPAMITALIVLALATFALLALVLLLQWRPNPLQKRVEALLEERSGLAASLQHAQAQLQGERAAVQASCRSRNNGSASRRSTSRRVCWPRPRN